MLTALFENEMSSAYSVVGCILLVPLACYIASSLGQTMMANTITGAGQSRPLIEAPFFTSTRRSRGCDGRPSPPFCRPDR
ncbi:hypothetical protein QBC39DRAFT_353886 [Podospora conica]|nr:hypothetical protein QBC39DRAFT_353886 [Schizothecium conicum]